MTTSNSRRGGASSGKRHPARVTNMSCDSNTYPGSSARCLSTRVSRLLVSLSLAGGFLATAIIGLVGAAPQRAASESETTEQEIVAALDDGSAPAAEEK